MRSFTFHFLARLRVHFLSSHVTLAREKTKMAHLTERLSYTCLIRHKIVATDNFNVSFLSVESRLLDGRIEFNERA